MSISEKFFRNDMLHRHFQLQNHHGFVGAGFVMKPGVINEFEGFYDYFTIVYVLRGKGIYTASDGNVYQLKPGVAFIRDPRFFHKITIDPESDYSEGFIAFQNFYSQDDVELDNANDWGWMQQLPKGKDYSLQMLDILNLAGGCEPVTYPGLRQELAQSLDSFLYKLKTCEMGAVVSLQTEMLELVARLRKNHNFDKYTGIERQTVRKACSIILQNPSDRTPLPELLNELAVSYPTLRLWFRQEMGVSLGDYRIRHRIDLACSMLLTGDQSIKEIAAELGYNDQFAFSRQFRKISGKSPDQFRRER